MEAEDIEYLAIALYDTQVLQFEICEEFGESVRTGVKALR
jgi:hypothetical protein